MDRRLHSRLAGHVPQDLDFEEGIRGGGEVDNREEDVLNNNSNGADVVCGVLRSFRGRTVLIVKK